MSERKEERAGFFGTYFNPSAVLRISLVAKIVAWFVLGVFVLEGGTGFLTYILMQVRRTWWGPGLTDHLFYLSPYLEKLALGVFFFVVLLAAAHMLEIFLDVEDNTRRAARNTTQKAE